MPTEYCDHHNNTILALPVDEDSGSAFAAAQGFHVNPDLPDKHIYETMPFSRISSSPSSYLDTIHL
jgi:hypothetical protein